MIKNIFFDMDGTLIDCEADRFIPPYQTALAQKFAAEPDVKEIVRTVLTGARAMTANDGARTNREAFFSYAKGRIAMPPEELETRMADFYAHEYDAVRVCVRKKPEMTEAVGLLADKGYRLVVTTNPLFPLTALEKRLIWGGYDPRDFAFVTSYETSRFAKPSSAYYTETLERLNMKAEETLIVGNDLREDVDAGKRAGLTAYYLTDAPIPDDTLTVAPDFKGDGTAFLSFVRTLPDLGTKE